MKKFITTGLVLSGLIVFGQNRVGINTESPKATLHIRETPFSKLKTEREKSVLQGVVFPKFTTEEREKFAVSEENEGTMIYNTSRKCLEIYTQIDNVWGWYCTTSLRTKAPTKLASQKVKIETKLEGEHHFTIPYTGISYGPYPEKKVHLTLGKNDGKHGSAEGSATRDVTMVIPAGEFTDGNGGTIPAYFETNNGTSYTPYCEKEVGNIYTGALMGMPFKVDLAISCSQKQKTHDFYFPPNNISVQPEVFINSKDEIENIPIKISYTGIGKGDYSSTTGGDIEITQTITQDGFNREVTLIIPKGSYDSTGHIPAYIKTIKSDNNLDLYSCEYNGPRVSPNSVHGTTVFRPNIYPYGEVEISIDIEQPPSICF